MEDAEEPAEEIDRNPELGTRCSSPADPLPLSAKFDRKVVSEKPEKERKEKTYCAVGIA